jgi:dTDP-4-amino-4,6-dideoxygalactose transaminase
MSRDQLWEKLQHKGVAASLPCAPVYRHPFIKSKYRIDFTAYPYLDKFCETVIELPLDPLIKIDELVALCHTFKKILR